MTQTALANVDDAYPLTPMQQGMLYHTISDPDSGVFVNQIVTSLEGELDVGRFQAAWASVAARHEALRTAFLWEGLDEPLQVVRTSIDVPWSERDLRDEPDAEPSERLARLLEEDRAIGFEPSRAPLMRMTLLRSDDRSWEWVWTMHHLALDGWSAQLVLDEVWAVYRTGVAENDPAVPAYRRYVEAVLDADHSAAQSHWRTRLAGFTEPHPLEVPGWRVDGAESGHATLMHRAEGTLDRLQPVLASAGVTLGTAIVGAWALVLGRWTRSDDVLFGVTSSGRDLNIEGLDRAVGLFIATLPARVTMDDIALSDWLRGIQKSQLVDRDHGRAALTDIHRVSELPPGAPLFESIVVFENYPSKPRSPGETIRIARVEHIEQSNYPLALLAIPGDESLDLGVVHDRSRIPEGAAHSLARQVEHVLEQFAEDLDRRVGDITVTPPADLEVLASMVDGPSLVEDDRTMVDLIDEMISDKPGAPAVQVGDRVVTYAELSGRSHIIGAEVVRSTGGARAPVGLLLERSADLVPAMIGIMRAGCSYVPLDPGYPPEHIAALLDSDAIGTVVTTQSLSDRVPAHTNTVLVDHLTDGSVGDLPELGADDLAYVIHTSGSTGTPKGVGVSHRNLVHSTQARLPHYGAPVERFLLLSSFAFDSSIVGIFWTLATGGTIVMPLAGEDRDADALLSMTRRHRVTHMLALPALYRILLEQALEGDLESLQVAIVAGEACPADILDAHRARVPHASLHNEYGPTEATVWCTVHEASVEDVGRPLPIGRPIPGARIYLLDERGRQSPVGFPGELCVAGPGVTAGYLNRPDLTAESFVSLPIGGSRERIYRTGDLAAFRPDGTIEFLGRADEQMKIRGHRIEAGAVEAAIRSQGLVRDVAVAPWRGGSSRSARLVAYVAWVASPAAEVLDAELRRSVPSFMVPDAIVTVEEIPRLPNGKVDAGSLPDPDRARLDPALVPPATPAEEALAELWADLLGLDQVSVVDDFFSLGGDSIVAIQMVSRARQRSIHIDPSQIVEHPTIRALAGAAASSLTPPIDDEPVVGPVDLSPIQRWFFAADFAEPDQWNMPGLFELPEDVDVRALEAALQAVVDHHDMLRSRFDLRADGWAQRVEDTSALDIGVDETDEASFEAVIARHQRSLSLTSGPVFDGRVIHVTDAGRSYLSVAVHHLVVDAVSWGVIVDDLSQAYARAVDGTEVALPSRTSSYRSWSSELGTTRHAMELSYWIRQGVPQGWLALGLDPGTEGSRVTVRTELDAGTTAHALAGAHDAYRTGTEDLLVAALCDVLATQFRLPNVPLALEGHGRDSVGGRDLTRTVGWFTTAYPVVVYVDGVGDDGRLIRSVKEQLRAVPDGGSGYGVLRYLQGAEELKAHHPPPVSFNYLSRTRAAPTAVLTPLDPPNDHARGLSNRRLHAVDVVALVVDDRLVVEWHADAGLSSRIDLGALAAQFDARVRSLIEHCLNVNEVGFTPSDFPESGLDQEDLDAFLEGLA